MADKNTLLVCENVTMEFHSPRRFLEKQKPSVKAVNDVSFEVKEGETFGLVGESGCGKTTLGKCIVRLLKPSAGKIFYNDNGEMKDLLSLDKKESKAMRRKIQIVFAKHVISARVVGAIHTRPAVHRIARATNGVFHIHHRGAFNLQHITDLPS